MDAITDRRATLQDVMLLTLGLAVGLALTRYFLTTPVQKIPTFSPAGAFAFVNTYQPFRARTAAIVVSFFVAGCCPALLLMRIRPLRLQGWALLRRPGFLIPAVVTCCLAADLVPELLRLLRDDDRMMFAVPAIDRNGNNVTEYLDLFAPSVLPAIRTAVSRSALFAAIVVLLARPRRLPLDWVDRLALLLASLGILAIPF